MTERPILFSGPMVRALLAGQKTQTRRIVKPQPPVEAVSAGVISSGNPEANGLWSWLDSTDIEWASQIGGDFRCPYGLPGDSLWGRETWQLHERFTDVGRVVYAATAGRSWTEAHQDIPIAKVGDCRAKPFQQGFRPSIHMPRWASRLTLDVTAVRVERLHDISEVDAEAEGVQEPSLVPILGAFWSSRDGYAKLWEHINGKGSWAANPWVWVVTFEVRP